MIPIDLREYQLESVQGLRDNIKKGIKSQILCSPTGSGKTVIGMHLLDECKDKGMRAIFVVERLSLIEQTSAMLDKYGIDHGVIQGAHWRCRPGERIQVATAQTLAKRGWPDVDLILVDESHVLMQNTLDKIGKKECIAIGLTATPFAKGLGKHYEAVVNVTTSNQLTDDGFLVPFKVFAAAEPDMKGAKVVAGEWTDKDASERAMAIVGDCVQEYLKHGNDGKFIAFGVDVNHCAELRRQFLSAGILAELHTYKTPDKEREQHMAEFRKPDSYIRGLISVSALSRGLDVPDCQTIVMCRPLRSSFAEFLQIVGRGLRPHPGKDHCVLLDLAGNTMRFWEQMQEFFEHGIHELDDGKNKVAAKKEAKPEPKPVKCPSCFHVHKRQPTCPVCGHVYPVKEAIQHVSGELTEFKTQPLANKEQKQSWYSQLLWMCKAKHYKPGWTAMKFRDKFGVWPRNMAEIPLPPTSEVQNWVLSQYIAWKKAKEKHEWTA